jgi:hypothetical protein
MVNRSEIKREYKENPPDMGVYRVTCTKTGRSYIGSGLNVNGKLNSARFQLEMGSFMDKEMQKDWNDGSPDDFTFEVLEILKPEKSPTYDYREDLKNLVKAWSEKLKSE